MAKIRFDLESSLAPAAIRGAATDFTARRPDLWPNIDPGVYQLHGSGEGWAEVTEGSSIMGGIWARERYDWSTPGCVRATVQDSNVFRAGGVWELAATALDGGGSHVSVLSHRQAKGLKGHLLGAMLALLGGKVMPLATQRTLELVEAG
jgi:hypothetical protein